MKILLSAYACEPNKGSEPEVGWKWATELSKLDNEVYVITRLNNKENIEKEIKKSNFKNLNFIYFDFDKWFLKIFKGKQNKSSYFYFYICATYHTYLQDKRLTMDLKLFSNISCFV